MRLSSERAGIRSCSEIQIIDRSRLVGAGHGQGELGVGNFELRCQSASIAQVRKPERLFCLRGVFSLYREQRLGAIELGARRGRLALYSLAGLAELEVRKTGLGISELDGSLRSQSIKDWKSDLDADRRAHV